MFSTQVEVEVFEKGSYRGGTCIVQWSFGFTPDKQGVFTMDINLIDQTIKGSFNEYNDETDEEVEVPFEFVITDSFRQVKKIHFDVENALNGFSITKLTINKDKNTLEVYVK